MHNELRSRIGQLADEGFFVTLDQLERATAQPLGAENGVADGEAASQLGTTRATTQSRLPTRHTKARARFAMPIF